MSIRQRHSFLLRKRCAIIRAPTIASRRLKIQPRGQSSVTRDRRKYIPLGSMRKVCNRLAPLGSDEPTLKYFLVGLPFPQVKLVLNEAFRRQALCPIPIVVRRRWLQLRCPQNGNIYRVMAGSAQHRPRLITHSPRPGNPPRLPDGTAIPGNVLGQHAIRELTHFYLEPS